MIIIDQAMYRAPEDFLPLPANEADRLAMLARYEVVDTPAEAAFDDIVAMAAEICGVPMALVSIVTPDRQFFKAKVGVEVDSTPRDISFCQFAILSDQPLIVPDALLDPRFVQNALVIGEMGLRFYAGFPLINPEGFALGTLCVLDRQPRTLDDNQQRMLHLLARQAMVQMDLRRTLAERDRALDEAHALRAAAVETAERMQVISQELAHRAKNTLAVVQSIVTQTFRHARSPEDVQAAIDSRLIALARSQDALVQGGSADLQINRLARMVLSPHAGALDERGNERLTLDGPPVDLGAQQALGLALGLHELATNSIKYGALGTELGQVALSWRLTGDGIALEWREAGGPAVSPRQHKGFGSMLLERIMASYFEGKATLAFPPEGIVFSLAGRVG